MSFYPPPSFTQFQGAYPPFPTQFQGQFSQSSFQVTSATPPPDPPTALELSAVTSEVASQAIQRLLSLELQHAGFDSSEPYALEWFEHEVTALIEKLFMYAHNCANHGNRAGPIAKDLVLACRRYGLETKEMFEVASQWKKRKRESTNLDALDVEPAPPRTPSPELLPSDDEDQPQVIPATLRALPHYIPALPPKHTYLRTPASPPKKAALPSLEKKLKNATLVQGSLKNLLTSTEDTNDQDDGEILGAVVNWEATTHPRKRWKVRTSSDEMMIH